MSFSSSCSTNLGSSIIVVVGGLLTEASYNSLGLSPTDSSTNLGLTFMTSLKQKILKRYIKWKLFHLEMGMIDENANKNHETYRDRSSYRKQ